MDMSIPGLFSLLCTYLSARDLLLKPQGFPVDSLTTPQQILPLDSARGSQLLHLNYGILRYNLLPTDMVIRLANAKTSATWVFAP